MSGPDDLSSFEVNPQDGVPPLSKSVSELASAMSSGDGAAFDPLEGAMAGIRAGNAIIDILKIVVSILVRAVIAPVEVILRWKFGERYFNGWVTGAAIAIFASIAGFELVAPVYPLSILGVFIVLSSVNRLHCFIRDRFGRYWHSYSEGNSFIRMGSVDRWLARWYFTLDFSKLVIEPIILVILSFAINRFWHGWINLGFESFNFNPFTVYLWAAALCLFLYQLYCYFYRRNLLLNEKDALVIAEIRAKLADPSEKLGISSYKGVTYAVLGPKSKWNR